MFNPPVEIQDPGDRTDDRANVMQTSRDRGAANNPATAGCGISGGVTLSCSLGDLASGQSVTIHVSASTTAYFRSSGQYGAMVGEPQVRGSSATSSDIFLSFARSSISSTAIAATMPSS